MAKKILIVEDNPDSQEIARIALMLAGYEVVVAGNRSEALQVAEAEKPDLVLMDLSLSEDDGFALARAFKSNQNTKVIPIIAYTGYSDPGNVRRISEVGCASYVFKPCSPNRIVEEISKILR